MTETTRRRATDGAPDGATDGATDASPPVTDSVPVQIGDIARKLTEAGTYRTVGRELFGFGIAIAAYPLGVLEEALEHAPLRTHTVSPVRNPRFHLNPGAYDVPVVLVHGFGHNRSGYWLLKNRLRRVGFRHIYTLNYNPWLHDVPTAAERLRARVERICEETSQPYVHVVGHSMGGLVSRYWVQCLGGADQALRVVTIGSPHAGTWAGDTFAVLGRTARQLGWQSPLIRMLNTTPVDGDVRFTSIYSSSDELVIPAESARLCPTMFDVENIHLPGEGHMSLLLSAKVMDIVVDRLGDIDELPKLNDGAGASLPPVRRVRSDGTPAPASSA